MRMILRHRRLCQCHFFVVADKPVCEKSSSVAVGVSRKRVSKVKSRTFWKISLNSKCVCFSTKFVQEACQQSKILLRFSGDISIQPKM